MKRHIDRSEGITDPRRRVEKALKDSVEPDISTMSADEIAHLVHELRTHQIELEKQNEELRRAQSELESFRDRYQTLYLESQHQQQEFVLLDQVRTELVQEFDPSSVYRLVVDALVEKFPYTHAGISLVQDNMLINHYSKGAEVFVERYPISQGITGRVARTGVPELVEDVHSDPGFFGWDDVVSEICVPLFEQDTVVGVLDVESFDAPKLSEEDMHIITAVGEHISIALDRARLYTELKESEARLRSLSSALSLAESRERRRIAAELHDSLAPSLSVIDMKLEILLSSAVSSDLAGPVREIQELVNDLTQHIRSLTFQLSPPVLYEFGLEAAVEWLTEDIQQKYDLQCACECDRQVTPIREDLRALLFISTRELLLNVVKHARARQAKVSIQREGDAIRIGVADDGVGFVYKPDMISTGLGLFSIRERLTHLGGYMEVDTEPGNGTRITMVAPLQGEKEGEEDGNQDSHS